MEMGELLWEPSAAIIDRARITQFTRWAEARTGRTFSTYEELWSWSVSDVAGFWGALWDYFEIDSAAPPRSVLSDDAMPGARWFEGATLSYAHHVFRSASADHPAMVYSSEEAGPQELSWEELGAATAKVAAFLKDVGVEPGDRVASFMPNTPATLIAFLACASIGAVWSSCAPDFGSRSVIDRFRQIEPKVLFTIDGYTYGGRWYDRTGVVEEIRTALPSLLATVAVGGHASTGAAGVAGSTRWADIMDGPELPLEFVQLPFDHPLWIVYTSGTTGLPKPIVHGQGGVILEHLKFSALHLDLGPGDRFLWYSSTGWIMWNLVTGGLLAGATIVVHDGNPAYPDLNALWALASDVGVTFFGTSAAFVVANMQAGLTPGDSFDLSKVRAVGSTGSPLPPEGFRWLYDQLGDRLWLTSASGGTDVATAFIGGSPTLPVHAGELQCRCLGVAAASFDEEGQTLVDDVGELVITRPIPTMPLYLWNDADGERYRAAYFDMYPGIWRHGDWISITSRGTAVIVGRSDSTINRRGVRIGTSELYSVVEELDFVADSVCVDVGESATDSRLLLFVVTADGTALDAAAEAQLRTHVRQTLSPRHVPDAVYTIPEVPRTLNGKKLEVPLKRIFQGVPLGEALNVDSMANPGSIDPIRELAASITQGAE